MTLMLVLGNETKAVYT